MEFFESVNHRGTRADGATHSLLIGMDKDLVMATLGRAPARLVVIVLALLVETVDNPNEQIIDKL